MQRRWGEDTLYMDSALEKGPPPEKVVTAMQLLRTAESLLVAILYLPLKRGCLFGPYVPATAMIGRFWVIRHVVLPFSPSCRAWCYAVKSWYVASSRRRFDPASDPTMNPQPLSPPPARTSIGSGRPLDNPQAMPMPITALGRETGEEAARQSGRFPRRSCG
jgi:hypothetical protein